jgi:hypothetical protein
LTPEQLKRNEGIPPRMCDAEIDEHEREAVRNVLRSVHGLRMLKGKPA